MNDEVWSTIVRNGACGVVCLLSFLTIFRHLSRGDSLRLLDEQQLQQEKKWQALTLKDKIADWSVRHQYTIILGGWAGSLALAGAIISRDR